MPGQHQDPAQALDGPSAGATQPTDHRTHAHLVSSDLHYDERCLMLIGIKGEVPLTKGQNILFSTLWKAAGAPVSAKALAARLAGDSFVPRQIKTARNAISALRRLLAEHSNTVVIENRYDIGYRLRVDWLKARVE